MNGLTANEDAEVVASDEEAPFMSETKEREFASIQMLPAGMDPILRRQYLQEMVKSLPEPVQSRITALKNLQLEHLKVEAEFFNEVYELEKKYQEKYQVFFDKRRTIVTGEVDPTKVEPKWKVESEEEKPEVLVDFSRLMRQFKEIPADTKGIPNFWLTIFRNTEIISEMIQDHDEPLLKNLNDIIIKYDDEHTYTLEFHFDANDYFTNDVLTKQYFLKSSLDEDDPFSFEGPEIYKCKGCNIDWKSRMNLTVKTVTKKQKHKQRGCIRTIVKQVQNESFFNFFSPPDVTGDKELMDETSKNILATDFEIGHFLRSRIIPKAVLYYTGDVLDGDDDDDEDDSCDDDEEDDESSGDDMETKRKKRSMTASFTFDNPKTTK